MKTQLQHKIDLKTKPPGSLGKLEQVALQIGLIQNTTTPELKKPAMIVFAGDHGITDEGVSPFPKEVTFQMVMNFLNEGAAINVFCKTNGISLKVVDAGVDYDFPAELNIVPAKIAHGTQNFLKHPAMTSDQLEMAFDKAAEIVQKEFDAGCNVIGFGEMGIGNTSSATMLMHKFTGLSIVECTGRGTGHTDEGLSKKQQILQKAAEAHDVTDPKQVLATYGGFEVAMMCGAMLKAAALGMVVLVDGFIASSAMLTASKINPSVLENAIFCHVSGEKGHRLMLQSMGVEPLLDLGMRLGEGSGAAVAYPIIKTAVAFLNDMASFEDAGVSNKDE